MEEFSHTWNEKYKKQHTRTARRPMMQRIFLAARVLDEGEKVAAALLVLRQ